MCRAAALTRAITGLSEMAYSVSVAEGIRSGQAWFALAHGRVDMTIGRIEASHRLFLEAAGSFARLQELRRDLDRFRS